MMTKNVWLIEYTYEVITFSNTHNWYIYYHKFFDTKQEALDELEILKWKHEKSLDMSKNKFRVRPYKLKPI